MTNETTGRDTASTVPAETPAPPMERAGYALLAGALFLLAVRIVALLPKAEFLALVTLLALAGVLLVNARTLLTAGLTAGGWLIFSIGFLMAALYALPAPPDKFMFTTGCILCLAGLALERLGRANALTAARRAEASAAADGKAGQSGDLTRPDYIFDPAVSLEHLIYFTRTLDRAADPETVQAQIEKIQFYQVTPIAAHRAKLAERLGPARFAAVFGAFSTGERYLNRAWSATVDGYPEEAASSLDTALARFEEARAELKK